MSFITGFVFGVLTASGVYYFHANPGAWTNLKTRVKALWSKK